jgi:hypothetical protein
MITVPDSDIAEDKIVMTTGSFRGTSPGRPAAPWIMHMVAFKTSPVKNSQRTGTALWTASAVFRVEHHPPPSIPVIIVLK